MHRMRPEKDIAWGHKYFSRRSKNPDELFPEISNPYETGRGYMIGLGARLEDLTPFLMHHVDDRVSEAEITWGVRHVAREAPLVRDFLQRSEEYGWLESLEARSSRVVLHHLRLLCQVLQDESRARELRQTFTKERGMCKRGDPRKLWVLFSYVICVK